MFDDNFLKEITIQYNIIVTITSFFIILFILHIQSSAESHDFFKLSYQI